MRTAAVFIIGVLVCDLGLNLAKLMKLKSMSARQDGNEKALKQLNARADTLNARADNLTNQPRQETFGPLETMLLTLRASGFSNFVFRAEKGGSEITAHIWGSTNSFPAIQELPKPPTVSWE